MAKFFRYFPKVYYDLTGTGGLDVVTNITSRFGFEQSLKGNSLVYYDYEIQEGDTPEIIAYKFYKDVERHWIVLLYNNILDPQTDWPLFGDTFNRYVDKKYKEEGGLFWALNVNNIHSYYKISTRTSEDSEIIEKFQITAEEYANTASSIETYRLADGYDITEEISKETKTYYQYEVDLNDEKRKLKLLKPEYVSTVEKEFKSVISK
jgi:hypothetical protein